MNILQDIKTTVKLMGAVRKIRRTGAQIKLVCTLPSCELNGDAAYTFLDTAEGCALWRYRGTFKAVKAVYDTFDADTKKALSFTPKEGEYGYRVRFWQRELRPVLDSAQYHKAMSVIIAWAIRCAKMLRGITA